jgi:hypothetical protein
MVERDTRPRGIKTGPADPTRVGNIREQNANEGVGPSNIGVLVEQLSFQHVDVVATIDDLAPHGISDYSEFVFCP